MFPHGIRVKKKKKKKREFLKNEEKGGKTHTLIDVEVISLA